uniref:transposase n=5 Tax=Escherichia TaxID=561 RepID=UPI000A5BE295
MEQKTLSAEPRRSFSNEFKLQMVTLALQPRGSVARIAREHDINDNLLFKWLRLSLIKGRISRRLPLTNSSGIGVELLPVEICANSLSDDLQMQFKGTTTTINGETVLSTGITGFGIRIENAADNSLFAIGDNTWTPFSVSSQPQL